MAQADFSLHLSVGFFLHLSRDSYHLKK